MVSCISVILKWGEWVIGLDLFTGSHCYRLWCQNALIQALFLHSASRVTRKPQFACLVCRFSDEVPPVPWGVL